MNDKQLFLKKYLQNPKSIGSLIPSSRYLANAIYHTAKSLEEVPILEIGAGTGAITQSIASLNPTVIDIDSDFVTLLKEKFPKLKIHDGCVLKYLRNLSHPVGLIISIPLINNPFKESFIEALDSLRDQQLLKWCVIYTYGMRNPLGSAGFTEHYRAKFVPLNFPPASVWVNR